MRWTILIVVVIAAFFVAGGIYVASGLKCRIEDKLAADQALVDGPKRPSPPSPSPPSPPSPTTPEPAPEDPPTPPSVLQAAAFVETLHFPDLEVRRRTGFFVSPDGRLITCQNLGDGVVLGVIQQDGTVLPAAVVRQDLDRGVTELQVGAADVANLETIDLQPAEGTKVWILTLDNVVLGTVEPAASDPAADASIMVRAEGLETSAAGAAVLDQDGKAWGIVRSVTGDSQLLVVTRIGSRL